MAVIFIGFKMSDGVPPPGNCALTPNAYCSGQGTASGFKSFLGGPKVTPGTVDQTVVIAPNAIIQKIYIQYYGSAQMHIDQDYKPCTGTGIWEIKLNVLSVTSGDNVYLKNVSICKTSTPTCPNNGSIYTENVNWLVPTGGGIFSTSGVGVMPSDWVSGDRIVYLYSFINTNAIRSKTITFKNDMKMMYPRTGHNQIGLGSGIIIRGDLSDVPPTLRRHTLVGS